MMKNAFYIILKAIFVLKIFNFFLFKVYFKIHDITTWLANNCNTHIAQYFTKKRQPDNDARSINRI